MLCLHSALQFFVHLQNCKLTHVEIGVRSLLYWWVSLQGGILGRFENVRVKKSAKKTVTCDAKNSAGRAFVLQQ